MSVPLASCANPDNTSQEALINNDECLIQVNGIHWHCDSSGSGPVCLLLHGTGASAHSWAGLIPELSAHYRVISLDLPGHARTRTPPKADLSLQGIATQLNQLLIKLNLEPQLIIGHSAGAAIMVELCLRHRCSAQRLVSINGALLPLNGLAGWAFSPLARLSASAGWLPRLFANRSRDTRQVRKLLQSTGSHITADNLRAYQALFTNPEHVAGVLRMMSLWKLDELAPRLPELHLPIHLIAATGDKTIPLRDAHRLKSLFKQAVLDVVEGKGHLVHEESPEIIARLILEKSAS